MKKNILVISICLVVIMGCQDVLSDDIIVDPHTAFVGTWKSTIPTYSLYDIHVFTENSWTQYRYHSDGSFAERWKGYLEYTDTTIHFYETGHSTNLTSWTPVSNYDFYFGWEYDGVYLNMTERLGLGPWTTDQWIRYE